MSFSEQLTINYWVGWYLYIKQFVYLFFFCIFYPPPKVQSSFIKLTQKEAIINDYEFMKFLQTCFAERRKKISNTIKLLKNENRRPDNVPAKDFVDLFNQYLEQNKKNTI